MFPQVVDDIREVSLPMVELRPNLLPGLSVWDIMEEMETTSKTYHRYFCVEILFHSVMSVLAPFYQNLLSSLQHIVPGILEGIMLYINL